jgi:host factor-I protein
MTMMNRPYDGALTGYTRRQGRSSVLEFRDRDQGKKKNSRPAPPEQTNAENFYYLKQMNHRTPMVVVMNDGERLHGWIEWYDRNSIKLNRENGPNLLIQKQWIKYLFKEEELGEPRG